MFKKKSKTESTAFLAKLDAIAGKKNNFEADPNEWTVTKDPAGNGSAMFRFLPAKDEGDEDVPFVRIYNHGYKHNGQWYIENCPTTINEKCPQCEANSELWQSGLESNKKLASDRKRKLSYWANIIILQDKANPETEGKVFKFRFGDKIMKKIVAMGNPEFDGEKPIDVTDVFEGANFMLKVEKISGQANYDKSKFGSISELYDGDEEKLKAVFNSMHALKPIASTDKFKSYKDLEAKVKKVLGGSAPIRPATVETFEYDNDIEDISQVEHVSSSILSMSNVANDEENLDDFFESLEKS